MFHFGDTIFLSALPAEEMPVARALCANIKSRKFPNEKCKYFATKGDYCSRHSKHPRRYDLLHPPISATMTTSITRSRSCAVKKIQKWWRLLYGFYLAKKRTPVFFIRDLCHNTTELASFGPLHEIPRDYFFALKESDRFWGFDIRSLVVQYESSGILENPYTKTVFDQHSVERFRLHVDTLRRWKKSIQFEELIGLTVKQSWNLRVLDVCLRLDMLGYRVATQWFSDLDIVLQRRLYTVLFELWNQHLHLTPAQREQIVPGHTSPTLKLFKWTPTAVVMKSDIDSIRRTNLNIMERLISSANAHSDRTLGAMYTVMALSYVSNTCRRAYPWLYD